MVYYQYCLAKDECLQDAWIYINRKCEDEGWVLGSKLTLGSDGHCDSEFADSLDFDSEEDYFGEWNNSTKRLEENSYTTITVNAIDAVGRVVFDDTTNLGVEIDGYEIGDLITVK